MKNYSGIDFPSLVARLYPRRAELFAQAPVKLVGIRGANAAAGAANSFATYDDQILVFLNHTLVQTCQASTDPTWYFVQNPIVRDSTGSLRSGQLCPGVHLFGRHLLHGQYPCFGQAEAVHLNRLKRDGSVDHIEYGDFAICIHSGGAGMNTGRFSLGCQIIQNDDGYFGNPSWNRFYQSILQALKQSGSDTFPYLLLNVADLTAPADMPSAPVATIVPAAEVATVNDAAVPPATTTPGVIATADSVTDLFSPTFSGDPALAAVANGTSAPLQRVVPPVLTPGVDRVQTALGLLGYSIDLGPNDVDRGYFGPRTQEKLIAFQQSTRGLLADGQITRETLFALDQALLARVPGAVIPRVPPLQESPSVIVSPLRADGYAPPPSAQRFLARIPFHSATPVGQKFVEKFALADQTLCPRDPSRCRALLRFPNGGPLYFDSKLAVDTDGSPNAKIIDPNPDDASTSTSWCYPGTSRPFDAEKIPYIVLPMRDKDDGYDFLAEMGIKLGQLAVVIYRDKIAGAIFADAGPTRKLGEGSVRLHELLGVNPWNHHHTKIIDSSISHSVLTFVFPQHVGDDLTPDNAETLIQQRALQCFLAFGGTLPPAQTRALL